MKGAAALAVGLVCALTAGCGDEACSDLSGSAAAGLSLSFDEVTIQHVSGATHSLVVKYASGSSFPAIFSVELGDVGPSAGLEVEWTAETGNVERVARDNQQLGTPTGGTLALSKWSPGDARGSVGARFEDGDSLRGEFCAAVQTVER